MSLQTLLFSALKSLVNNRVYPTKFPEVPVRTWPAIRYTVIDRVHSNTIDGSGDDNTAESRIQLDLVDNSYADVQELRLAVIAVMDDFFPPVLIDGDQDTYDAETKTDRVILDYVFYPSSPAGSPQ